MENKKVSERLLVGSIVASMFLWGLSWPSGKVLTHYASVFTVIFYRYLIVVATLLPLLFFIKVKRTIKKQGIPVVVAAGLIQALYGYLSYMGLKNGSGGAGGVMVTTLNPIMAYALGIMLSRKLPSRNEAAGLALGIIAGCVLLRIWDNTASVFNSGNLYFLLAAMTWATLSKLTSKATRFGSSPGFSLWQYVVTLICLAPFMNMKELLDVTRITDSYFWWNMFFSSAIVTTLATTIYFYATTRLGAEKASSFIFLVPLAAAVSAWIL